LSDSLHGDLSVALATRLNLQISLSSIPVVEEWMDPKMDRWLEAVPMPTELPQGERAQFVAGIASDLSRLRWSAFGHPAGFVPKMADYLSKCGVSQAEVAIINAIGERHEPAQVGTWIAVRAGSPKNHIATGWQFVDALPLADLARISADIPAVESLAVWAGAGGVESCTRFARRLGDEPHAEIAVSLPNSSVAEQAFSKLGGFDIPAGLVAIIGDRDTSLVVRAGAAGIERLSVIWPPGAAPGKPGATPPLVGETPEPPGTDGSAADSVCESLGVPFDDGMSRVQGALGATDPKWLEVSSDGTEHWVDLYFEPGSNPPGPRPN